MHTRSSATGALPPGCMMFLSCQFGLLNQVGGHTFSHLGQHPKIHQEPRPQKSNSDFPVVTRPQERYSLAMATDLLLPLIIQDGKSLIHIASWPSQHITSFSRTLFHTMHSIGPEHLFIYLCLCCQHRPLLIQQLRRPASLFLAFRLDGVAT